MKRMQQRALLALARKNRSRLVTLTLVQEEAQSSARVSVAITSRAVCTRCMSIVCIVVFHLHELLVRHYSLCACQAVRFERCARSSIPSCLSDITHFALVRLSDSSAALVHLFLWLELWPALSECPTAISIHCDRSCWHSCSVSCISLEAIPKGCCQSPRSCRRRTSSSARRQSGLGSLLECLLALSTTCAAVSRLGVASVLRTH